MNTKPEDELEEDAAGSYLTPNAFRKPKKQDIKSPTGFESSTKPNMYKTFKYRIVKPKERLNSKDLWKEDIIQESKYTQFKSQTTKRSPKEILHKAIKEIQMKMDEVNRLIDFTSRIKGELIEGDQDIEYLKRTKNSLFKIQEKLKEVSNKINHINNDNTTTI